MSLRGRAVELFAEGRSRLVEPREFPLAVGGPTAAVPVPGTSEPLAFLGLEHGEVFVQPAGGAPSGDLTCNGVPLRASRWLRDGDEIASGSSRLRLETGPAGPRLFVERRAESIRPALRLAEPPTDRSQPGAIPSFSPAPPLLVHPVEFRPRADLSPRPRAVLPRATLVVVAAVLVAAAAAGFLFSARAVDVSVAPAPDRLAVHGGFVIPLGGRRLMRPGRYVVVAEKVGYRRLEAPIEVGAGHATSFAFRLVKLPGRVTIETVAGAEVAIGGRPVGTTPLPPLEVEAGVQDIQIRAEGYLPATVRVEIEGMGAAQTVKADLTPNRARVSFDSAPAGATVALDGRPVGKTPLAVDVSAGTRVATWSLAGYKPHRAEIQVVADQPRSVPTVVLVPTDGRLVLRSTPTGGAVTIDGAYRGETPLTVDLPPGRPHALRVSRAAYETATAEVSLAAGEEKAMDVALEAKLGEVQVTSRPPDAEVLVNGESRGRAGQTLKLPAVPHEIEVRRDGYLPYKATVTPRPGFSQALRVTLLSQEEGERKARPPLYKAAGGPELRLVEGGRLQMGASRREPGRRANETLRLVELVRPFYVSLHEITNQEFRLFKADHTSGLLGLATLDGDAQPVVNVTWEQAAEYCNWLSARESLPPVYRRDGSRMAVSAPLSNGYRLPTEAEWELVARRAAGGVLLKYPWGAALPVAPLSGNYADASAKTLLPGVLADYQDRHAVSAPVGSYPPNALGFFDLGGNVAEWAHDLYSIPPAASEAARDPTGPTEGEQHVIRGSSFMHASVTELRLSFRDYGTKPRPDLGFRVARYAE